MAEVIELQGCRRLVYAEVLSDDNETEGGYKTGEVKELAPVQEIGRTREQSSETKYYDNKGGLIVHGVGSATMTFTIGVPADEVYADICGLTYDQTKKMIIGSLPEPKYFAVGYVIGEIGKAATEKYVWWYKGTFQIPDDTNHTKDNSTTTNNMSLTYTAIFPDHVFTNGKGNGVKGVADHSMVRAGGTITEDNFFKQVYTPDTVTA